MKKMLILNGSHSELYLIEEAKKLGYYVITTGNRRDLIGHKYADEYIYGDFSNQEDMLKIATEKQINAICSCANDFGAISASYVAEKLNLPGHDTYETTLLLHQKNKFKSFAKRNGLQTPMADVYDDLDCALAEKDKYNYPVIVKPIDLTGGKGVGVAYNSEDYINAVAKAIDFSRQNKIVVEKYIVGTYHSFSTFLVDKKVIAWFNDNEFAFTNPFGVATSSGPAANTYLVKDILIKQAEIIAEKLNLVNGVFHMQYVMDKDSKPYIIDICRRCSGDLYAEPVEHSTQIPWSKWIVMAEAGFAADSFMERGKQTKFCGRHCIMAKQNGIVKDVKISTEFSKNIYKSVMWWKKGDEINNFMNDKLGIIFFEFSSVADMHEKISCIDELVEVHLE